MKKPISKFSADLAMLKVRAMELGLWRTFHALDAATKEYVKDIEGPSLKPKKEAQ